MELSDVKANIEMEKTLLSALMIKGGVAIPQAAEILKPDDFYRPEHRLIYKALLKLSDENVPVDELLVENQLEAQGDLKRVTRQYLFGIVPLEYSTGRVEYHAKIIKDLALLRRLMEIGRELTSAANAEQATPAAILADFEQKLTSVASKTFSCGVPASQAFVDAFTRLSKSNEAVGIDTGLYFVDVQTNGLRKSELIILAARPGMGKTAFALNIAANVAKKKSVVIFSLEMSRAQLEDRMISAESRISYLRMQNRAFTDGEYSTMLDAVDHLSRLNLILDDTSEATLSEIKAKARKIKRERGLDLIIIDYLQLMQSSSRYAGNRVQEVSELSRGLKMLAKELDIPVLALSQLSRSVEMRAEKKPQLSDLRESGSIEQDADIVMFLYREDYYERDTTNENIAELIISKNRNGATGIVPLHFAKEYLLFHELTRRER